MLFSVVIPTFNRLSFLPSTLASVRSQRFVDYEVIVVDDGSSDGTQQYLRSLGDRVRIVEQSRRGPGAARNAGAAIARGDYLAFLDSDDLWFPWTLELLARVIAEKKPALIAGRFANFHDERELAAIAEASLEYRYFNDYLASSQEAISAGAGTVVISRDAFARAGGFVTQTFNGEDHDLALRLGTAPGFVEVLRPVTIAWRGHPASETADLTKSVTGAEYLVAQERAGAYPGGAARAAERRRIITRHVRPVTLACVREGRRPAASELYRSTFSWNAGAGRWAYLAAFPVISAWAAVRGTA